MISYRLKTYLSKKHGVHKLIDLQKIISSKTGIVISTQNLSTLVNGKPIQLRLSTMELICSALSCKLSDILEIKPREFKIPDEKQKWSHKNTPNSKRAVKNFPDPKDYT
jgi:putative transcriptional regulator